MKKIAITQRVDFIKEYRERRDSLDQAWTELANQLGIILIPMNNKTANIEEYLKQLKPDGIIFSGGNSTNEREKFEHNLLQLALDKQIPCLGVCRGLQQINKFFGGVVEQVNNHVNVRHDVQILRNQYGLLKGNLNVNSYHENGVYLEKLANTLKPIALANDNTVEALCHTSLQVAAIMWHPERETVLQEHDMNFFKEFFQL